MLWLSQKTFSITFQSFLFLLLAFAQLCVASETNNKPSNDGKFTTFYRTYVQALNNRDVQVVSDSIDIKTVFDTAIETKTDQQRFKKAVTKENMGEFKASFAGALISNMGEEGYATLVKPIKASKNHGEALLRVVLPTGAVQYLNIKAQASKSKIQIVEWFDYSMGQTLTTNVSAILEMIVPREGFVGKIKDIADGKGKVTRALQDMTDLKKQPSLKKAKAFFSTYKKQMVDNWIVMTLGVQLMAISQDQEFNLEILTFLDKHYGDDTRAGFLLFDYYFLTNQFDKAIAGLDRYIQEFGIEDGGLLNFKLLTYYQAGDYASSIKTAKRCIEVEPSFAQCYWIGLASTNENKDYAQTVNFIDLIVKNLGYEFTHESLSAEPAYAEFIKSKEYADWDYIQQTK